MTYISHKLIFENVFKEILKLIPTFLFVHTYFDEGICDKKSVQKILYLENITYLIWKLCQAFYESSIFIKSFPGSFSFDKVINFYFYAKHLITN